MDERYYAHKAQGYEEDSSEDSEFRLVKLRPEGR
jgi:hypothetical protein